MSDQEQVPSAADWAARLADAVTALRPAAGQFARDPSDTDAAKAATLALAQVGAALADTSHDADLIGLAGGEWPWLAESRAELPAIDAALAPLAAGIVVDDSARADQAALRLAA